mmetsp:Transcript_30431/g.40190  ORF Transcript_30431/g.40190 Transcript_30431/m.40190 type:complete len:499 (-) Transcript_30431:293-1789(-)
MVDRRDHVFRAQAYRGFRFIPVWVPGQFFIDVTVALLVFDVMVTGWYYVVHFWDFLVDMTNAIKESRWPVDEDAVYSDVLGYTFKTSLFDIPCLAMFRAVIMITVWMKWPTKSFPLLPLACTVFLAVKASMFEYTISVETNNGYYDFFLGDAVALMIIASSFSVAESLAILLGNFKTRFDLKEREKFRVKKGRCPVCTMPVDQCKHEVYMDKMQVFNVWNIGILECHKQPIDALKICCLCWCPCTEGTVALETSTYCCFSGFCYAFTALTCCPFGIHGFIGGYHRYLLRKASHIKGTPFRDWLEHWFCPCCALVQEKNQLEYLKNPPKNEFRTTVEKKKIVAPMTTEEMLRDELEEMGNIAGGLTAEIAVKGQEQLITENRDAKVYSKIRQEQYLEDMKEAIKEVAKESFFVSDDPLANEGGGEEGDAGLWHGDRYSKWRKKSSESIGWKPQRRKSRGSNQIVPFPSTYDDEQSLMNASISSMDSLVPSLVIVPDHER